MHLYLYVVDLVIRCGFWYVVDLIIICGNTNVVENIIRLICFEFKNQDLGLLRSFLGIEVTTI